MSKPIGVNGLALNTQQDGNKVVFDLTTLATKILYLDPSKEHNLFVNTAGHADLTFAVTMDSTEAIAGGYAQYAATKTATDFNADGYVGAVVKGARAVKVTHAKNGVVADDSAEVARLGGRCCVRAVPAYGTAGVDAGITGDYTQITLT